MKQIRTIFFVLMTCLTAVTCKKDSTTTIVTDWNLVNDSINSSIGIAWQHSNYKGMNSDFFNFSANGKLYFKEGTTYDSCNYNVLDGNKIILESFSLKENGAFVPSTISVLTATTATIIISTDGMQNPGGSYERIINLSRH